MARDLTYVRHLKNKINEQTDRSRLLDTENKLTVAGWEGVGGWRKGGGEEVRTGRHKAVAGCDAQQSYCNHDVCRQAGARPVAGIVLRAM